VRLYAAGAADDWTTILTGSGVIDSYYVTVNGGVPGGTGEFRVITRLYSACPGVDPASEIPGTAAQSGLLDDDDGEDQRVDVVLAQPVFVPQTVWLKVQFTTAEAGVVVGGEPTLGSSEDAYWDAALPSSCTTYFGGTTLANFGGGVYGSSGETITMDLLGSKRPPQPFLTGRLSWLAC